MSYYCFKHTFENGDTLTSKSYFSKIDLNEYLFAFLKQELEMPINKRRYYVIEKEELNKKNSKLISLSSFFIGGIDNGTIKITEKPKDERMLTRDEIIFEDIKLRKISE